MNRHVILTGVAVLALVAPDPTVDRPAPAAPPPARPPVDLSEGAYDLPSVPRPASARPDEGRHRSLREPSAPRLTPRISSHPDDPVHRARVDRAVARFARAGLLLPDVHVEFSDDGCDGNLGLFERSSTPWRISVCSDLEFVVTHELAHAWAAANLDESDRAAYTEYRGLSAWHAPDLHWRQRGTEDAAFVIQQVLMARHISADRPVWIERIGAYEQLTGGPPAPPAPDAP